MVVRADRRIGPSAVERSAPAATGAMAAAVETLQSHLEFVLDERAGHLNAEQRRFLDVAVRYGDRLVRLAEDLRTIALADAGELEIALGRVDLAAVAQSAVEHVWPVARVEGKALDLRSDGPVAIEADLRWVERAVVGLLADAVDATVPGTSVRLDVRDDSLELGYEGAQPPGDVPLALADAVARLHGGELVVGREGPEISLLLRLSLAASAALPAAA
ncbi:MAG TPA: hypothetical protein VHF23_07730 [Gaiellaceae bacterium]|nr:hypothetical protein [Gaiellaceae bacterium]